MKTIRFTEVTHQWKGTAIVRNNEGKIQEIDLGIAQSDKKLKETGAKELFKVPENTIAIEVEKLTDISITYELNSEDFKQIAKVVEVDEEKEFKNLTKEEKNSAYAADMMDNSKARVINI